MRANRQNRGQNLVLFSLTLLPITLMVMITLAVAMRVREKIEIQTVADAAAYSNAVVTARTFNSIALLNRTELALLVAQAGVESEISWAGMYRAALKQTANLLTMLAGQERAYANEVGMACDGYHPCPPEVQCARATFGYNEPQAAAALLNEESTRIEPAWDDLDANAGQQARDLQSACFRVFSSAKSLWSNLQTVVSNQSIGQAIANQAKHGSPWASSPRELFVPSVPISVSAREIQNVRGSETDTISAAMGTRGAAFTRDRAGSDPILGQAIYNLLVAAGHSEFYPNTTGAGSGYWGTLSQPEGGHVGPNGFAAYGEDHGQVNLTVSGFPNDCYIANPQPPFLYWTSGQPGDIKDYVRSTDLDDTSDMHYWTPPTESESVTPDVRHTMYRCIMEDGTICHGVWVAFLDYNPGNQPDVYSQPKNYSVIQRDFNARGGMDPWNMLFNFKFSNAGAGVAFDTRGVQLVGASGTTDMSVQTALAAGIAYYHRGVSGGVDHTNEPPNLFNPFWRATLINPDVDAQGQGTDMPDTMTQVGSPLGHDATSWLLRRGYKGF